MDREKTLRYPIQANYPSNENAVPSKPWPTTKPGSYVYISDDKHKFNVDKLAIGDSFLIPRLWILAGIGAEHLAIFQRMTDKRKTTKRFAIIEGERGVRIWRTK